MAEKIIKNPSITSGDFSFSGDAITAIVGHPIAGVGGGGTQSDYVYVPSFDNQTGDITFTLGTTASEGKGPWHISGAQGPQGPSGTNGTNGISPTFTITPTAGGTHVTISGAQGEDSFDVLSGAKGTDGTAGFSPTVSTTTTASEDRTGTVLTFTYGDEGGQTVSYTAWNGKDGTGATVDLLEGTGIQISHTGTNYTISVSADYALKSELPDLTDYYKKTETSAATALSTEFAKYTIKPDSSLVDKYLVLRTDNAGNVSGWYDLKDQCYSKTEAQGTFVATAYIDNTTLSGDGKSASTKLGVKTDVIATQDYVNSSFLPLSGGTVTGQLVVSGGSNFDQQFLKITRENVNGYARLGLGQYGALALKTDDSNSHTTQINVSPNTTNDQLVQVQHNGNQVGFLIPAVTATTTDGLTNDGILHIILES